MSRSFAVTYDYLCPFARIANETIVDALRAGADWDVSFRPFSLAQSHVEDGDVDVWERPQGAEGTRGVVALQWSLAVKELSPDRFHEFHVRLFDARHSGGADVDDPGVLRLVAETSGVDADVIAERVADGGPMKQLAEEHSDLVEGWAVFGVPTFIEGEEAVFIRLMERKVRDDVDKVLDLLAWSCLNEFKRTRIPR